MPSCALVCAALLLDSAVTFGELLVQAATAATIARVAAKQKEIGLAHLTKPEDKTSFAKRAGNYQPGNGYEDGQIAEHTDHRA